MKMTILLAALVLGLTVSSFSNEPILEGGTIFNTRCAACHNVNKVLTGPALAGVDQRRSIDWIINFVHGSQAVIKSGDRDAVALFEKFNKIPMPDHPDLTDDNIKSIVAYIKSAAQTVTAASKAPFRKPGRMRPQYHPLSLQNNYGFFLSYIGIVLLMAGALVALVKVKNLQRLLKGEA
jgi:cytochrome c551/c552